jgi:hypothetical protein
VSGASDALDPVEAAQDDIDRSKHPIASTLDDLRQHHRWLENYHRAERRRVQRLRRQEALYRLELKRRRTVWTLRRLTVVSLVLTRSTAAFLVRNGAAFMAWAAPRAHALALLLLRSLSAALSWSWATAVSLSRTGFERASIGLSWTVRTSDVLGTVFRRRLSAGFGLLCAKAAILAQPSLKRASMTWVRIRFASRRLASTLQRRLADSWSWTRPRVIALAQSSAGSTSRGLAWLGDEAAAASLMARDRFSLSLASGQAKAHTLGHAFLKTVGASGKGTTKRHATMGSSGIGHWSRGSAPHSSASSLGARACRSFAQAEASSTVRDTVP